MSNNKDDILVSSYGTIAPKAAKFGVGARVPNAEFGKGTQPSPQVEEATRARREAPVGALQYARRDR